MFTHRHTQQQTSTQNKNVSNTASIFDSSSQSEALQRKADMANNAAQRAEAPRPNNTGMPDNLKSGIESLSGFSMDDVRVHYNSSKPATVQALAYTQGTDIHVAPGQEKHLPHEAWHVAQQMAGRVSPTTNINGMPVNDNAGLEHEADVMGEKAVQRKSDECKTVQRAMIWNGVAQRCDINDYYYHICNGKILDNIKPRIAIDPTSEHYVRKSRGDDLGPGFYMGDSNFLKYYYNKNFKTNDAVIYYIKTTELSDINDFTDEKNLTQYGLNADKLFQIAMQLGFRSVNEEDVNNHSRILDLLDPEKEDEVASEKEETFDNRVRQIYPNDANVIIDFFKKAKKNAIWKGYINDVENDETTITLEKTDIKKIIPNGIEGTDELIDMVPRIYNSVEKDLDKGLNDFIEKIREKIRTEINKLNQNKEQKLSFCTFINQYKNLFKQKNKVVKYNYMGKDTEAKPIQIAIRKDENYTEGGTTKSLLGKIKENMISITKTEIDTAMETEGTKSEKDKLKKKLEEFLAGTSTPPIPQNSSV